MRDKGISRNIGAGGRRPPGEDAGLGGFARAGGPVSPEAPAPTPSSEKGERRRRRMPDDGRHFKELDEKRVKSAMMLWTMLLGAAGVVVIVLFVLFWLRPYIERRDRMAVTAAQAEAPLSMEEPPGKSRLGEKEAVALAMKAMAARTEEEILAVIDPGPVPAAEVGEFLKALATREGEISRYDWMVRLDTPREDMAGVVVSFLKEGEKGNRIALFSPEGTGRWKMDFPAFARLATPSWEELLSGEAPTAVVRIYVEKDQYFNGPFREEDGWICYGVASPDVDRLLFGYCRKDSEQARVMRAALDGRKMARVTTVLGNTEGADGRQFLIKRVLAHDWLVGDEPVDASGE
ncbi:MAG: hypothetical protein EOP87_12770 [Verrucomicrobiaceae bacterium]|nr:MAG: hypothetical protein EOP87_12770 [Verrucomicrobiaceae bacterium]